MEIGVTGHNGLPAVKLAVTGQQLGQGNVIVLLPLAAGPLVLETQNKRSIVVIVCIVQVGDNLNASIYCSSHFFMPKRKNMKPLIFKIEHFSPSC